MAVYYLSLLGAYAAQYIKSRLAYRVDFAAAVLMEMLQQLLLLVTVFVVFRHVPALKGWTRDELLFIYGYFLIPWGLFSAMAGKLWYFGEHFVVKGELDRLLTRPAPNLFQLLLEGLELESLIGVVNGTALLVTAGRWAGVEWRWWDGPLLLAGLAGSVLVYLGIYVGANAVALFTDSKTQLPAMVFNINHHYGRYPVNFYNRPLRFIMTCVLPFAFVGVYPSAYFLRREAGWLLWALLTPLAGALSFAAACGLWRAGLRRYCGAGS